MSGILYFYGLLFHQGLLYVNKVLPHNVKALRYKPAGRGFDSRWCHCNFSVT